MAVAMLPRGRDPFLMVLKLCISCRLKVWRWESTLIRYFGKDWEEKAQNKWEWEERVRNYAGFL